MSIDAELQHSIELMDKHSLVWGLSYRNVSLKQNAVTSADHSQDLGAAFAEDQFRATDRLTVFLGGRLDNHPLVKSRFSPRGGLLYTVKEGQVAHAVRCPGLPRPHAVGFLF